MDSRNTLSPPGVSAPTGRLARGRRFRFLGLTFDQCIKAFFGGNALVAVVVLTLITVFLFREGFDFFGQNRQNLVIYRRAGLEFVDLLRAQESDHTALTRYLSDLRLRQLNHLTRQRGLGLPAANAALADFDRFAGQFEDAVEPLRGMVSDLTDVATGIKTKFIVEQDKREERRQLLAEHKPAEAARVRIEPVDFARELQPLLATPPACRDVNRELAQKLAAALAAAPAMPSPELAARLERFKELTRTYVAGFPGIEQKLESWDYRRPVPWYQTVTEFMFGREWLTASFWQDWYGIIPLFVGSLMVSAVEPDLVMML